MHRLDPLGPDRALGPLHDLWVRLEEAAHVRVLVLHLDREPRGRLRADDALGGLAQQLDVRVEQGVVEVAQDRPHHGTPRGGLHLVDVDEALAPRRGLRG